MKIKSIYEITFLTKKGGEKSWIINVEASTAKEAKAQAMEMWYKDHTAHAFDVQVRKLKDTEEALYNYFKAH